MQDNKLFIRQVKNIVKPQDTILSMCRSGARGAQSVDKLAKYGYKNVYNITDGLRATRSKTKTIPVMASAPKTAGKMPVFPGLMI